MVRLAIVEKEKCKPDLCGWLCEKKCPVNMTDSNCIYEGPTGKAAIDEILCTGCGICPKICPFHALTIINLPSALDKPPINQYGKNGFRIFDLPIIQEDSITGIIGRNGIGKSTVINTLANTIKANFGDIENLIENDEDYFKKLKTIFKGTVLQNYFEKLEKKEIKVAYKPQQIISIPQMFKGEVRTLFKKITKNEKLIEEIATRLNIIKILDRDISVLSGGELQRVAIEAALLKEGANFFVFDEITNYLDIYERLNSSRLIKESVEGKTALLVEHDLVVLDYLVDYIHIMYGQPSAYGTLTGIKSAKAGINSYLEGFSKEENVRFRDKPITFEKESVTESKRIDLLAAWEKNKVEVGTFKLNVESGDIKKGEVMGIIGRNALGKSTFVKNLVDNGLGDEIVISYKPQLIPLNNNLVSEELCQFPNYTDTFYQVYVLEPLSIEPLIEKKISSLSGGELQRYAIARCLIEDANLYLLDEPTAFLDIEDRLKIAKMIKNFISLKTKSAFIIDHDLVFMDYLSDKLIVFQGDPSIQGNALTPLSMRDGMNLFLKDLNLTFRRDDANKRPRVNKSGSVKDQEQKKIGEYYYA
ncbi:MAG: ribosome biogenesis/translation initiation ATPase RLI [Candidatus Woesearchaeota archaeon]|jgi:ATP-binding cassette subfamily E protein 1|nr:ribosome biogenesis/translation initiation ATPase RLI [Candidatus Woesearchaeota archaeon]